MGEVSVQARQMRVSRRSVLRGGLAGGLIAATMSAAGPSLAAEPAAVRYVVFDTRLEASRKFARMAQARGAEALDIAEGLTRLWREHLIPHWQSDSRAVIGLTTRAVWDCMAIQSRDHFRRPCLLDLHDPERAQREPLERMSAYHGSRPLTRPLLAYWTIG